MTSGYLKLKKGYLLLSFLFDIVIFRRAINLKFRKIEEWRRRY